MTTFNVGYHVLVGLLPVLLFLLVLVYLDSYKLVKLRVVLAVMAGGAAAAVISYFANDAVLAWSGMSIASHARYVSPVLEEFLKAMIVLYLLHSHRIGFLVDAAILGFAVGAGFALFENLYYLLSGTGAHVGVWIVRGFGTAIMHGGTTALFAILAQAIAERGTRISAMLLLPGLVAAVILHAVFNHFPGTPIRTTLATVIVLPLLLLFAYRSSAATMQAWLRKDFDADAELLAQIQSASFADSPIGRFLHELRDRFDGPTVVDMLCYLRVYTELAIRAKGLLLAREAGIELPVDETVQAQLDELNYLEHSIGSTGLLAMRPFLVMERKDLWQMGVLGR